MKEDVLEQVVDDYLMHHGYFTRHNLRFMPAIDHTEFDPKTDSNHSDIDVVGIHPFREGAERVLVLSCKAWQGGFDPAARVSAIVLGKTVSGRPTWKGFRELCQPKWSEAFVKAVENATGSSRFTYCAVVTKLLNPASRNLWETNAQFRAAINGNPIRILTLAEMLTDLWVMLTKTPAASEIGRAIQLMKAAGWRPPMDL
jgi:hypothetical protein